MSLTRDQITARVRVNLNEEGVTFYSANDLNDSVQDAYHDVVSIARTIESTATVNFAANLSYYDLSSEISDYLHVIGIYNNTTSKWLDYISLKLLQELDAKWETKNGNAKYFTVLDDSYIAIFPKPSTATGSMLVVYKAFADTLGAAGVPIIPEMHETVLEKYVTMDLLEQQEEFTKAMMWFEDYRIELLALKQQMDNRNTVDRIMILQATGLVPSNGR